MVTPTCFGITDISWIPRISGWSVQRCLRSQISNLIVGLLVPKLINKARQSLNLFKVVIITFCFDSFNKWVDIEFVRISFGF